MQSISAQQCQCARVLLDWGQADLAVRCGLHVQTICLFETGKSTPSKRTLEKITSVLVNAGIEFIDGNGVRRAEGRIQRFQGIDGLKLFMDDVYAEAKSCKNDMYFYNVVPENWLLSLGEEWWAFHAERMSKYKNSINIRIFIPEGNTSFISKGYATYKWFPKHFKLSGERSLYVYGNKLGFVNFDHATDKIDIFILQNKDFAESVLVLCDIAWKYVATKPTKNPRQF